LGGSVEDQQLNPANDEATEEYNKHVDDMSSNEATDPSADHYPAEDETQFSELRITNVEGSAASDSAHSLTPNYEDIVTDAAGETEKTNGLATEEPQPESGFGQYDEVSVLGLVYASDYLVQFCRPTRFEREKIALKLFVVAISNYRTLSIFTKTNF
jgi:hypothetical protein